MTSPQSGAAVSGPAPILDLGDLSSDMNLLVLGVDATGADGEDGLHGNTDTMLLLHLAPHDRKIYVFSIPRDTRVPIAGHGIFKINAANVWGGPELAAQTVADLLRVPIHRYLLLSLAGLVDAIDAIGGVNVTVPKRLDYDDFSGRLHIHLPAGFQHLDGRQVEQLLRFRHDQNGTDVARVQRQQDFLMEAGRQFLKPRVILRLPELWSIASRHAQTNLAANELLQMARWARHLDPQKDVQMTVLPGTYQTIDRLCFWIAKVEEADPFLDAHFRTEVADPGLAKNRRVRVSIWDATGKHLNLRPLERQLSAAGYQLWAVDRRFKRRATSRVIVGRGDAAAGRRLGAAVGLDDVYCAAVGDLGSDFTIELGTDWINQVGSVPSGTLGRHTIAQH